MKLSPVVKKTALAVSLALGSTVAMAECGTVTVAEMNWASAEFAANLDKVILEEGYGCSVELVPGATVTTFASMESKGQPDIAPELWANAFHDRIKKAADDGKVKLGVKLISDAAEGWFVSKAIADKYPEIKTVQDVLNHPELFPSKENPGKGQFMNCPSGWACQIASRNLAKPTAYDFAKHNFIQVDPGSSAGLDGSIAKAYDREEAWFGYYWQPTVPITKYELKKLDFGVPFDKEAWDGCIVNDDCAEPKKSDYTPSEVLTVVMNDFAEKNPDVMGYLDNRIYDSNTVGKVIVYMDDNQASGEDGAYYFLQNFQDVWTKWVPADVADKIKAAL